MGCTPTPATLTCCAGLGCRSDNADIPILKPDFHLLVQLVRLPIRLSLCFPASLKTYQREQQGLTLLRPVALTARPGRPRAEKAKNFASRCSRSDANAVGRPVVSHLRRPYASPGRSPRNESARDPRPSGRPPVS